MRFILLTYPVKAILVSRRGKGKGAQLYFLWQDRVVGSLKFHQLARLIPFRFAYARNDFGPHLTSENADRLCGYFRQRVGQPLWDTLLKADR